MDINNIIKEKNAAAVTELDDDRLDELLMKLEYEYWNKAFPRKLNEVQTNLYLCSRLDDCVQADSLYSFVEEGMGEYLTRTAEAYDIVGAPKTAELIRNAAAAIPQNVIEGDEPDDELFDKLMELDEYISDYPDGVIREILIDYARKHSNELL